MSGNITGNLAGLAKPRFKHMHDVLSSHVERGELPGMVYAVCHNEDLHVESIGTMAMGSTAPMRRDCIFRIASLSKPIVAAAAIILLEDCKFRLDQSIEAWLPELANRAVLRSVSSELDDTVLAKRAISVRDLLTYRMGLGSIMAAPNTYPIQKQIRLLRIGGDGAPKPASGPSQGEWLNNLSSLPLIAHPGDRWLYHVSADVLGVLLERVSGLSLGAFLQERLFEPLGMKDTGFFVPEAKQDRLMPAYRFDYGKRKLEIFDDVKESAWGSQPPFESAGGGLVSTVDDYFAFSQMLLNKGRHKGKQILSRAAVELMTTDQLDPADRLGADIFFGDYRSWGMGLAVDIKRDQIFRIPGRFGWDGGMGTSAYTDPLNNLNGVLFTQRMMDSPAPPTVFTDFWTLAYGAME